MQFRIIKLPNKVAVAAGVTAEWEAPSTGYLAGVLFLGTASTVTASTYTQETWRPHDLIDPIQVTLNESFNVVSATARQLISREYWNTGLSDIARHRMYTTGTTRLCIPVSFGKYMFDPFHAINLSMVDSCKVKLSNSMSASTFTSPAIDCFGIFIEDPNVGKMNAGFMRFEEYREWTTTQAGVEYINLPHDGKLRKVYFQMIPDLTSSKGDADPHDNMRNIKYTIDSGSKVLYDDQSFYLSHLATYQAGQEAVFHGMKDTTADNGIITGLLRQTGYSGISMSIDAAVSANVPTIGDDSYYAINPEDREADSPIALIVRGLGCESMIQYSHDNYGDGSDYLDLHSHTDVMLEVSTRDAATAADGTNRIVIERYWERYP